MSLHISGLRRAYNLCTVACLCLPLPAFACLGWGSPPAKKPPRVENARRFAVEAFGAQGPRQGLLCASAAKFQRLLHASQSIAEHPQQSFGRQITASMSLETLAERQGPAWQAWRLRTSVRTAGFTYKDHGAFVPSTIPSHHQTQSNTSPLCLCPSKTSLSISNLLAPLHTLFSQPRNQTNTMEFFFPADVLAAYPRQARTQRPAYEAGPSANVFSGCGFDSHPLFADSFADAIQQERAAYARAQAQRAQPVQQREAQRRYQLEQLQRQRHEALRRQQYEEYQRRKAYAIEKERQRIAAARAAQDESRQLFLALEDLLFGGLTSFCNAFQQDNDEDDEDVELAHKNDTAIDAAPATAPSQIVDAKGKAKATEQEVADAAQAMDVDKDDTADDTAAAAASALMQEDADPEEVGPAPTTATPVAAPEPASKTEQLVFSHAFPSTANFDKTSVRADQINVSVDEAARKVTVSGLWNNESAASASPVRAASPAPSDSSSRRGRSRSPKRARVSDVDENGDEIVTPEANDGDDDFVEVSFTRASSATVTSDAPATVEKTFDLPQGANVDDLRAELTDEGLKLFTTVSA
ncbi:hypothetical protein PANT_9d00039 [Moesziomyces antarcticus T-34]|uniref:Uncharacterized protein n=1 Tax=Pseudozyma antarctica (strain T-34) TaxID=1151754 RepID=M9LUY4_PSEA3|nr:hypothetical protein PANT_9d00039 [Moesziomyces antarcticus T-34]